MFLGLKGCDLDIDGTVMHQHKLVLQCVLILQIT